MRPPVPGCDARRREARNSQDPAGLPAEHSLSGDPVPALERFSGVRAGPAGEGKKTFPFWMIHDMDAGSCHDETTALRLWFLFLEVPGFRGPRGHP